MAKRENHYYKFYFIDGTTKEYIEDNNSLLSKVTNESRQRIRIKNEMINLNNVIRVDMETQSERDKKQKEFEKQQEDAIESLSELNF